MGDMVTTPTVIVDEDVLDRNIAAMAETMAGKRVALRPHVKTHKIIEIARRQIEAGAVGLSVATIGEAEVFAAADFDDVFIAYPLWLTRSSAQRLAALTDTVDVSFGVDSAAGAVNAARLLGDAASEVEVLVEIDSGHHRTGVPPADVVEVATAAADAGLRVAGVFTFPGHSYGPDAQVSAATQEAEALQEASEVLGEAGFRVDVRSGGSSPSARLTDGDVVTEARPGVYVFGDAQQWELGAIELDDIALTVLATVVSRHDDRANRRIVLDSGSKILGGDRPAWATGYARLRDYPDARVTALSEHHATVEFPEGAALPTLGSRIRVIPNHVCPVLNLVDDVAVVRGNLVVGRWPVAARGRNG